MKTQEIDLAVIGGGPAGLAAASRAKEAGLKRVMLVERSEELGGILPQCIHNGFGLHIFRKDLTGPEYAHHYIQRAQDLGVELLLETMCIELGAEGSILALNPQVGLVHLKPKAVVLSMGCRERTRAAVGIAGTRPAGIFTAGTSQRFINIEGCLPGKRIVVLGSGDIGMIMARRLTLEGAKVEAVVEILPYTSGLIRNEVQCLMDYNIPLLLEHTVTEVHGEERVQGVTIAKVDGSLTPIAGTERLIPCDTLLLSVGLIPENELSKMAGVELDPATGGPFVNEAMETGVPGLFASGNVVHVHDLVDYVTIESELAGESAARSILEGPHFPCELQMRPGENIRYIVPHRISGQRDVTLYMRVREPAEGVSLNVGGFFRRRLPFVRPSEMIRVRLRRERLSALAPGTREIVVSCEGEG